MADILIRGMEKPTGCYHNCPLEFNNWCKLLRRETIKQFGNGRFDDCPLIELPPHGGLVDLDEVIKVQVSSPYGPRHDLFTVKQYFSISGAKPTVVVPSNKEGTK